MLHCTSTVSIFLACKVVLIALSNYHNGHPEGLLNLRCSQSKTFITKCLYDKWTMVAFALSTKLSRVRISKLQQFCFYKFKRCFEKRTCFVSGLFLNPTPLSKKIHMAQNYFLYYEREVSLTRHY